MNNIQILNYFIGALIVLYNGAIWAFMLSLKRVHNDVWKSFGGTGVFRTDGALDSTRFVRTGFYALFQSGYRTLKDFNAAMYVFFIRTILLVILALVLIYVGLRSGGASS